MRPLFTCLLLAAGAERVGNVAANAAAGSVLISLILWNLLLGPFCAWFRAIGVNNYPGMLMCVAGYASASIVAWMSFAAAAGGCYWAHREGARLRGSVPYVSPTSSLYWYFCGFIGGVSLLLVAVGPWWAVTSDPMDMLPKQLAVAGVLVGTFATIWLARCVCECVCRQMSAARDAAAEMYVAAENMEAADATGTRSYASV